uniref:Homeobox-leucine zipper protein GLABRA 2 n=1 Tax=Rhizophora mucronata TaxID=61149 RepID=A0A2P2JGR4_RHIMU
MIVCGIASKTTLTKTQEKKKKSVGLLHLFLVGKRAWCLTKSPIWNVEGMKG